MKRLKLKRMTKRQIVSVILITIVVMIAATWKEA